MVISQFGPWKAVTKSAQHFITYPDDDGWRQSKLTELNVVNITGALIASVVTGALAWEAVPWTTQALFYSTLILSLTSVSTASQQSIALYRLGGHRDGLEAVHRLLQASTKDVSNIKVYVWQLPVMLLNVSIALFIIGLVILVWDHAARKASWDRDMKIGFVATLAGVFALANYILGTTVLYRSHQNELEGVPEALSQQQNGNTNAVASNGSTDGDTPGPRNVQSGLSGRTAL